MPRTLPVYLIDAAWSRTRTGAVTIGTSTIGSADQIGGLFSHYTFASIKNDVKDITISRGVAGQGGTATVGRCTIRLADTDGTYNPENAGSPLSPDVVPMRPIRVRATHSAVTYGLFFGFVTRIEHDPHPSAQETVIEAEDFLHWLNVFRPTVSLGETTVGAAIGAILAACGLTDPAYLALDTGHTVPFVEADGDRTALALIGELLRADMGVLFVDGDGKVTYHDTTRRYAPGAVTDTFTSSTIGAARPATDIDTVRNGWTVKRLDAQGQTVFSTTRIDNATREPSVYGPRDDSLSSPYFDSDTRAESLAAFKALLHKDPLDPASTVRIHNDDDTLITKQLARDLGDTVALSESLGGTSLTGWVDGARHRIWQGGKFHEADFTITRRRFTTFTIGTSTIGGSDVIGY
jgi:hypothetical protein